MTEAYKILTREYYNLRNVGLANHSDVTDWQYQHANLSWPDGYTQDYRTVEYHTRLGNTRKLIDDPRIG